MDDPKVFRIGPPGGGLYNALFGRNPLAETYLAALGLLPEDVGRFRDAYVYNGEICVYTRNGGGNREEYQPVIDKLKHHPLYLRDTDDAFDNTYCTIYFSIPESWLDVLKTHSVIEDVIPENRWKRMRDDPDSMKDAIARSMQDPGIQEMMAALQRFKEHPDNQVQPRPKGQFPHRRDTKPN